MGKLKDPRIIASAMAVSFMLLDNLPESQYNTFHDPGAAAMLSIIFADVFTLLGRQYGRYCVLFLIVPAFFLKYFMQIFFWVENAWFWDVGMLILAHFALAWMAFRSVHWRIRLGYFVSALGAIGCVLFVLAIIEINRLSWVGFYWELGLARILIPWVFWAAILKVESRVKQKVVAADTSAAVWR